MDDVKHRVRKLKKIESKIRWNGEPSPGVSFVWDDLFDLRNAPTPTSRAKYNIEVLSNMSREEYKNIVDDFFARVYYEYYLENGITGATLYDPSVLALLDLPFDANEQEVKKRFRELAKKHHPDKGGNAANFIELMKAYEKLTN